MATVMDNLTFLDIDFPCYSTTTTTTSTDDENCNWKEWSPVVNWDELSGDSDHIDINTTVDFVDHDFIECMLMDEDNPSDLHIHNNPTTPILDEDHSQESVNGLRLVHLLMAAAEALTGVNKSHELLARVILVRLKELVSPNGGTNIERLVAHFTDALQGLIENSGQQNYKHDNHHRHQADVLAAFQLLQDMSPYVKFGHFTANQAILEAVTNDRRVHIIDYDIMEGIQWASLMQALVSRKNGPKAPHLKITALSRSGGVGGGAGRRSFGTVQETGRRLAAFAASIGQPFSFHQCKLDSDHETFKPSALKLVKGEALIINCMLHLPHFSYRAPDSVSSFLSGAKALNPRLITLVEEEEEETKKVAGAGETTITGELDLGGIEFVGKFMESLHHYSAVYDSLDSGFPMQDGARELVERVFLGPRIARSVSKIYRERGETSKKGRCFSWADRLSAMGFHPCGISFANHCQAKLLLGLFNDGYRVEELGSNKLVLGWKSRRLLSASVWSYPISDFF